MDRRGFHCLAWVFAVVLTSAPLQAAEPLANLIDAAKTGSETQRVQAIHQLGAENKKAAEVVPVLTHCSRTNRP